jgi:cytochrome c oxidase subunit 2
MEESTRSETDPVGGPGGRRTIKQMVAFGVVASALGIALGLAIDWFPQQGSAQARKIDTFWDVLIICSVPFFVLVVTVVLFAARDFRMRPGQENVDGPPIHGNTKLEVVWTAIPAVVLVALCTYAFVVLHNVEKAPAAAAQERHVEVFGEQFNWTFAYNEGGKKFSTAQLYVPEGESVKFMIRAKDVLHDFWVPAWRMKIDAVPGITTSYRITPIKQGNFPVVCAELCGLGHAFMRNTAHVLSPAAFKDWVAEQIKRTTAPPAATTGPSTQAIDAKDLFANGSKSGATACGGCHKLSDAGTTGGVGPDLDTAIKGRDAAFIKQSIVDPGADVTKGFANGIMPGNYGQVLSAPEIDALVGYLEKVAAK